MKIKIAVGISLFVFISLIMSIVIAGFLSKNSTSSQNQILGDQSAIILTMDEIAKHNLISDCWLLISGKVYNVTSELSAHPGGVRSILPYCGKEATNAFSRHSSFAYSQLSNLLVGSLAI